MQEVNISLNYTFMIWDYYKKFFTKSIYIIKNKFEFYHYCSRNF